jgi:hypothetical protein
MSSSQRAVAYRRSAAPGLVVLIATAFAVGAGALQVEDERRVHEG